MMVRSSPFFNLNFMLIAEQVSLLLSRTSRKTCRRCERAQSVAWDSKNGKVSRSAISCKPTKRLARRGACKVFALHGDLYILHGLAASSCMSVTWHGQCSPDPLSMAGSIDIDKSVSSLSNTQHTPYHATLCIAMLNDLVTHLAPQLHTITPAQNALHSRM